MREKLKALSSGPFIEQAGRLRFYVAPLATVALLIGDELHGLCQLGFSADGSVIVTWPYLPPCGGMVASVAFGADGRAPAQIQLAETGKVTANRVKYSHHVSGRAHFSLTGRTTNEIGRSSFSLRTDLGRLFDLQLYHPAAFERIQVLRRGRLYIAIDGTTATPQISAVQIRGEWMEKAAIERDTVEGRTIGPKVQRVGHEDERVYLCSPPLTSGVADRLLAVKLTNVKLPDGADRPGLLFFGGRDPHAPVFDAHSWALSTTGVLVAWYPERLRADLRARVGSIDKLP